MSSNSSYVSGAGCSRASRTVACKRTRQLSSTPARQLEIGDRHKTLLHSMGQTRSLHSLTKAVLYPSFASSLNKGCSTPSDNRVVSAVDERGQENFQEALTSCMCTKFRMHLVMR